MPVPPFGQGQGQGQRQGIGVDMHTLHRGQVRIAYSDTGPPDGPAVLCLAPGGMRSTASRWATSPFDAVSRLAEAGFRTIAMDQRNAGGGSSAPIAPGDGWASYTADQLALIDHLGLERVHVVGMCIGGTFAVRLARAAPDRIGGLVLVQPIGWSPDPDNRDAFYALFDAWAADQALAHPEAQRTAMFGGTFQFGAGPDDVAACRSPMLVLMGDDVYHPAAISREIARLAPAATLIEVWKGGAARAGLADRVAAFLRAS